MFEFRSFAVEKAELNTSVRVRSALVAVKPGAVACQSSGLMLINTEGFSLRLLRMSFYI